MKRTIKFITAIALGVIMIFSLGACSNKPEDPNKPGPEGPTARADVTAPVITPSYGYKIVLKDTAFTLPEVKYSEEVTASYALDGAAVQPGAQVTPTEVGTKKFVIKAEDGAGNKSQKTVVINVTDDAADLNQIYDLSTVQGLEAHVGTSRGGLNNTTMKLITPETKEAAVDYKGEQIPDLKIDASGEPVSEGEVATIDSYSYFYTGGTYARIQLSEPLYTQWDKKFSALYFYVYNASEYSVTVRFNAWAKAVSVGSGWQKVVVAPKEVDGKIVTDYEVISASGRSVSVTGMIDLEDCVGAFLRIDGSSNDRAYDRLAITSVFGEPLEN